MSSKLAMLSPNSINPQNVGGGGIPELKPTDVAAAMAGMPRLDYLYAMHAFVYLRDQYENDYKLQAELLDMRTHFALRIMGLLKCQHRKADRLAAVVLNTMHDGNVCTICNGHGVTFNNDGSKKECTSCDGKAKLKYSENDYAKFAGIAKQTWNELYRDDWHVVCSDVSKLRYGIMLQINFQLDHEVYELEWCGE